MKLSTFIRSYMIALYSICDKISDWKSAYLDSVSFQHSNNRVLFTFSDNESFDPGSLCISVAINTSSVENIDCCLEDYLSMFSSIKQDKINYAFNILVILDSLASHIKILFGDCWNTVKITNAWFSQDRIFAYFELDQFKDVVQTDGRLFLFGDLLNE